MSPDRWSTFTAAELDKMEYGLMSAKLDAAGHKLLMELREHRKRYNR